jgi:hypothetical protein
MTNYSKAVNGSCKEIYQQIPHAPNGKYIIYAGKPITVYCAFDNIFGYTFISKTANDNILNLEYPVVEGVIDSIDIVSLNGTGPISQMARKKSQKDIWCKCYVLDGALVSRVTVVRERQIPL